MDCNLLLGLVNYCFVATDMIFETVPAIPIMIMLNACVGGRQVCPTRSRVITFNQVKTCLLSNTPGLYDEDIPVWHPPFVRRQI